MIISIPCLLLCTADYAVMCNVRGSSDSLRERIGYEYGVEGIDDPAEHFGPPYWDHYGGAGGPYDISEGENYYGIQQPPLHVPVRVPSVQPREYQPQRVDPYGTLQSSCTPADPQAFQRAL